MNNFINIKDNSEIVERIVSLLKEACQLGHSIGIKNLLNKEFHIELEMARLLGHSPNTYTRGPDALGIDTSLFEYKSCIDTGSLTSNNFQFHWLSDNVREKMTLISKLYCGVRKSDNVMVISRVYELDIDDKFWELYDNKKAHVGLTEKRLIEIGGKIVYSIE